MIVVVLGECESLDSWTIAVALEFAIELKLDSIFDQLVDRLTDHQYRTLPIGIPWLVRSMKIKPHHLRKFRQTDSSLIDFISITRNYSNKLFNFALHQFDIHWTDMQQKAVLTKEVKSERIDNDVGIARVFPRGCEMSHPEYLRSPEFLQRKLAESDCIFDDDRVQSKSALKSDSQGLLSSFPIGNRLRPSTGSVA
jgi:hypothetical protein